MVGTWVSCRPIGQHLGIVDLAIPKNPTSTHITNNYCRFCLIPSENSVDARWLTSTWWGSPKPNQMASLEANQLHNYNWYLMVPDYLWMTISHHFGSGKTDIIQRYLTTMLLLQPPWCTWSPTAEPPPPSLCCLHCLSVDHRCTLRPSANHQVMSPVLRGWGVVVWNCRYSGNKWSVCDCKIKQSHDIWDASVAGSRVTSGLMNID
jgi:hypothetical protein